MQCSFEMNGLFLRLAHLMHDIVVLNYFKLEKDGK